jgi:hypothetical protein
MRFLNLFLYFFIFSFGLFAQSTYYYINPETGFSERLHWTPTPIGTYATYKTDNDKGNPKKIKYLGNPLKQESTVIILPNREKAVLTQVGEHIQLKFKSGKIKVYKNRQCWSDITQPSFSDYIAFEYTNPDDKTIYFRGLGLKKEVKCIILEEDKTKHIYKIAIPNMEGIYEIHTKEAITLKYPSGKIQVFEYEPL